MTQGGGWVGHLHLFIPDYALNGCRAKPKPLMANIQILHVQAWVECARSLDVPFVYQQQKKDYYILESE
jgi:hypothetical protein